MAGSALQFTAVSSSARQLFLLLRCIAFATKAQVQITVHGLRFSVELGSYMEAMVLLEKNLFTTYMLADSPIPQPDETEVDAAEDDETGATAFEISLPSLLETLQIFGLSDPSYNKSSFLQSRDPFASASLGISSLCRISYAAPGEPLIIHLEEGSVRTSCELVTYEPASTADIPFARNAVVMKVIIRGSSLLDAINELSANDPGELTVKADKTKSTFTLSSSSELGSAFVEFRGPSHNRSAPEPDGEDPASQATILETFQVAHGYKQKYKFSHVGAAKKAMAAATKVSIRGDEQGVLSLQFMIENIEAGGVSFVDFRFVPLVDGDGRRKNGAEVGDSNDDDSD